VVGVTRDDDRRRAEPGAPEGAQDGNDVPLIPDADATLTDAEKWSRSEDEKVHDEPESE
jgi:hypothetical protein